MAINVPSLPTTAPTFPAGTGAAAAAAGARALTTTTSAITTTTAALGVFDVYRMTTPGTTLTVSTADITEGRVFIVRAIAASAGSPVTINTQGAETIDGATSIVLNTAFDSITLQATGGNLESIQ